MFDFICKKCNKIQQPQKEGQNFNSYKTTCQYCGGELDIRLRKKTREGKKMILSKKLKVQIKSLLMKLIRGKKTSIIAMKEQAYQYAEERLPKWFVYFFGGYIRTKIDTLFMEALSDVKDSKATNI